LRESFDDSFPAYKNFVNYWFGNPRTSPHLIMLCGHPSETQLEGIEPYVDVVHKTWDLEGITCERAVINILVNKKVLPRDIASAVMQQDNRLREGASPRRRRYTPGKS
jgi:hypothetical protein